MNDLMNITDMAEAAKNLQQSAEQAADEGVSYLRFSKGDWTYGADSVYVEEDSLWVVHPGTFKHGYIAWGKRVTEDMSSKEKDKVKSEKLGEIMVPATEALPFQAQLPDVFKNGYEGSWAQQVSMQLMCINGEDKGVKVLYNANSLGGRKMYQEVVNSVVGKLTAGVDKYVPVVKLESGSYQHPSYGKTFTPAAEVAYFVTGAELQAMLNGDVETEQEAIEDKAEETENTPESSTESSGNGRRRRKS